MQVKETKCGRKQKKPVKRSLKKVYDGSSDSSNSDIEMSFADSDDDMGIFEIDSTKCGKGDNEGFMVGCDTCPQWWHKECTGDPDLQSLNASDLEDYPFNVYSVKLLDKHKLILLYCDIQFT